MLISSSNFLVPNATFFVELIAFVLLLGIVAKWILPPINGVMVKRQEEIAQSLTVIDDAKVKMEEATAAYEQAMVKARDDARNALEQANRIAEEIRAEAQEKAKADYDRLVARATTDIEAARQQALRDLQEQAAELALVIAGKVVDAELDAERHRHLIDEVVSTVETRV